VRRNSSRIDIQFAETKIKVIMAKNFAAIAFTDAVKAMQKKPGRSSYARMERDLCG